VVHFWRWVWSWGLCPGGICVFLNPGTPVELFWTSYSQFMQAAADDLHIACILYSNRTSKSSSRKRAKPCLDRIARTI
jgi:hypothetical protein